MAVILAFFAGFFFGLMWSMFSHAIEVARLEKTIELMHDEAWEKFPIEE